MTDVEIKTSDLAEMNVPELEEMDPLPSSVEIAAVNETITKTLNTTLPADDLSTDLLQIFLRDVSKFELLNATGEVTLAKMKDVQDQSRPPCCTLCTTAAEALVNHNLRMVITVANRYHRGKGLQGIGYLDLIQEGMIGLLRAVELYDHTKLSKQGKPYRFSTYAMWWIRQAVARGLADKSRSIRVPMHVIEKLGKLTAAEKQLHAELGREPTVNELAELVDLKPGSVAEILRGTAIPISLSRKEPGHHGQEDSDDAEFGSALEDATTPSPHDIVAGKIDSTTLSSVLADLHPRTLDILQQRFGLTGEKEQSLTDIGKTWGITYQRVRQIELEVLSKLKAHPDLQTLREQ